ncbi:MAG: CooT family nickel-binding protein [Coriobacteriales bacterium]|jgi:predicted RNA-binding protein|nr:CooT family nickel-binding protein [Coriobacteriales bacterium]
MCLSTVRYATDSESDAPIASNVTSVVVNGSRIMLTDLMGSEIEVVGAIVRVDLIKNHIIIATAA